MLGLPKKTSYVGRKFFWAGLAFYGLAPATSKKVVTVARGMLREFVNGLGRRLRPRVGQ